MKFFVSDDVFEKLPEVCFALIAAKGIDNKNINDDIRSILDNQISKTHEYFKDKNIKEYNNIACYREAFQILNINPNKFMCSIEALVSRVVKKNSLPSINSIVDLVNITSLKYTLPMGAHDILPFSDDICIRFSKDSDIFSPIGGDEVEYMPNDELVYASSNHILTRRWIWRQSEIDKITEKSSYILFPIDGFKNKNYAELIKAKDELESNIKKYFNVETISTIIDKDNREFDISL